MASQRSGRRDASTKAPAGRARRAAAAAIINHIRAGTWVRPGISEHEALSIVSRTTDLHHDSARDEITLELLSMA